MSRREDTNEEILRLLSCCEGVVDTSHGSPPGLAGHYTAEGDTLAVEIFAAMRSAESAELLSQLNSIVRPSRPLERTPSQPTSVSPATSLEDKKDSAINPNPNTVLEIEANDQNGEKEDKLEECEVFYLPEGIQHRMYVYGENSGSKKCFATHMKASKGTTVVYWCAPGVARSSDNAALAFAIDISQSMKLPLIAMVSIIIAMVSITWTLHDIMLAY